MPYIEVIDAAAVRIADTYRCTPCARTYLRTTHTDADEPTIESMLPERMTRTDWREAGIETCEYRTYVWCSTCGTELAAIENEDYCGCGDGCYSDDCDNCRTCPECGERAENCMCGTEDPDDPEYERATYCDCENCTAGVAYVADLARGIRPDLAPEPVPVPAAPTIGTRLPYDEQRTARATYPSPCPDRDDMCTCGERWGDHHGTLCPGNDRTWVADDDDHCASGDTDDPACAMLGDLGFWCERSRGHGTDHAALMYRPRFDQIRWPA